MAVPGAGNLSSLQLLQLQDSDPEATPIPTAESVLAATPEPIAFAGLSLPVKQWVRVSDRYGAVRRGGVVHAGIDLVLTDDLSGSKVYPACPGLVTPETYGPSYGINFVIDCGDGWTTVYAHLGDALVSVGDRVTLETVIGYSGLTGYTSGEHLHFEVRRFGVALNPEDFLDFGIPPGAPLAEDDSLAEDPADRRTPPPGASNPVAATGGASSATTAPPSPARPAATVTSTAPGRASATPETR